METVELPTVEASEDARWNGTKIGAGAFRDVYRLGNSRWVYKFDGGFIGANKQEAINYNKIQEYLGKHYAVPEMILLENGALAAEFVEGKLAAEVHAYSDPNCVCMSHGIPDCWRKLIAPLAAKFDDLHGRNVIISPNGKLVIIDIGEGGYDSYSSSESDW